jgi:hypothetical protein
VVNNLSIVNSSGTFTLPAANWEVCVEAGLSGGTGTATMGLLEIQVDDAAISPPVSTHVFTNGLNQSDVSLVAHAYVPSSGSTTVRARVTYTSASGTLVCTGDQCRISFRLC